MGVIQCPVANPQVMAAVKESIEDAVFQGVEEPVIKVAQEKAADIIEDFESQEYIDTATAIARAINQESTRFLIDGIEYCLDPITNRIFYTTGNKTYEVSMSTENEIGQLRLTEEEKADIANEESMTTYSEIMERKRQIAQQIEENNALYDYEGQERLVRTMSPTQITNRTKLLSRLIANYVQNAIQEKIDKIQETYQNAATKEDKDAAQKELLELAEMSKAEKYEKIGVNEAFKKTKELFSKDKTTAERMWALNFNDYRSKVKDFELFKQAFDSLMKNEAFKKVAEKFDKDCEIVYENYDVLLKETKERLQKREGLKLGNIVEVQEKEGTEDDTNDDEGAEEGYTESWAVENNAKSIESKLSERIKNFTNSLIELQVVTNAKGQKVITKVMDDMGIEKEVGAHAYVVIGEVMTTITSSEEMIDAFKKRAEVDPFLNTVVQRLEQSLQTLKEGNYDGFFSEFWFNCASIRSEFVAINIESRKGVEVADVQTLTRKDSEAGLIRSMTDSLKFGNCLAVQKDGTIVKEHVQKVFALFNSKANTSTGAGVLAMIQDANKKKEAVAFIDALKIIGIDMGKSSRAVVEQIANVADVETLEALEKAFDAIKNTARNLINFAEENKNIKSVMIGDYSGRISYKKIAKGLGRFAESYAEANVTRNGKTRFARSTPNFLGKLSTIIENIEGDSRKRALDFLAKNFLSDKAYSKDGKTFTNALLEYIRKKIEMGIKPNVNMNQSLLDRNEVEYPSMARIATVKAKLEQFFGRKYSLDENSKAKQVKTVTNYFIPIQSDAPSCNIITAPYYTDRAKLEDMYIQILLDELDRISKVGNRAKSNTNKIAAFDAKVKDGRIVPGNGMIFHFLTGLNSRRDEVITVYNEASDKFSKGEITSAQVKEALRPFIQDVMKSNFEAFMKEAESFGLFRKKKITKKEKSIFGDIEESEIEILENLAGIEEFGEEATVESATTALEEFFFNSQITEMQVYQFLTKDVAFYSKEKNATDLTEVETCKRFKEIHAPRQALDTNLFKEKAAEHGYVTDHSGRICRREIYLKDFQTSSKMVQGIRQALMNAVNSRVDISVEQKKALCEELSKMVDDSYDNGGVCAADAQGWVSSEWYIDLTYAMGNPKAKMIEEAFKRIEDGTFTEGDLRVIMQTQKPYKYGYLDVYDNVNQEWIKVPQQTKNSEACISALLNAFAKVNPECANMSIALRALNKIFKERHIHAAQFESAIKVGGMGILDFNDLWEAEIEEGETMENAVDRIAKIMGERIDALEEKAQQGSQKIENNGQVIHNIPIEDMGIQTSEHEHIVNKKAKIGKQINKLCTADLAESVLDENGQVVENIFTSEKIPGHERMTKQQLLNLHGKINAELIRRETLKLDKALQDPKVLSRELLKTMEESTLYSDEVKKAIRFNETTQEFEISFEDPTVVEDIQKAIQSKFKKARDIEINGGTCTQLTCVGLDHSLKMNFDKENNYLEMECYMPAYTKGIYECYMKEDGSIDIERMRQECPEALEVIGYRTPTEDKYSMCVLKIKGFLPECGGSQVVLPYEVTTLSGADFDIDHLYFMLPALNVVKEGGEIFMKEDAYEDYQEAVKNGQAEVEVEKQNSIKDAWDSFFSENPTIAEKAAAWSKETGKRPSKFPAAKEAFAKWLPNSIYNEALNAEYEGPKFKEWLNTQQSDGTFRRDNYKNVTPETKRLAYDEFKRDAEGQIDWENSSDNAVKNGLIQVVKSVLRNKMTATSLMKPQGFETLKIEGNALELKKKKRSIIEKAVTAAKEAGFSSIEDKYKSFYSFSEFIDSLSSKEVQTLLSFTQDFRDPMSPLAFCRNHNNNFMGKQLLAIYAVHVSAHAEGQKIKTTDKMSQEEVNGIATTFANVEINGHRITKVDDMISFDGVTTISSNLAEFLGGAADNVKDPTLVKCGQNKLTVNLGCFLLRAGFSIKDVAEFCNSPLLRWMSEKYAAAGNRGSIDGFIREIFKNSEKDSREAADNATNKYMTFRTSELLDSDKEGDSLMSYEYTETPKYEDMTDVEKKQFHILHKLVSVLDGFEALTNALKPEKSVKQTMVQSIENLSAVESENPGACSGFAFGASKFTSVKPGKIIQDLSESENLGLSLRGAVTSMMLHLFNEAAKYFPITNIIGRTKMFENFDVNTKNGILRTACNGFAQSAKCFQKVDSVTTVDGKTFGPKVDISALQTADERYQATKCYYLGMNGGQKFGDYSEDGSFIDFFDELKNNDTLCDKFPILKHLQSSIEDGVNGIVMKTKGLKEDQKADLRNDWLAMATSGNPVLETFANQLAIYCNFRDSFSRYQGGFADLIPEHVKGNMEGYREASKEVAKQIIADPENKAIHNRIMQYAISYIANNIENINNIPKIWDRTSPFGTTETGVVDIKDKEVAEFFNSPVGQRYLGEQFIKYENTFYDPIFGKQKNTELFVLMGTKDDGFYYMRIPKTGGHVFDISLDGSLLTPITAAQYSEDGISVLEALGGVNGTSAYIADVNRTAEEQESEESGDSQIVSLENVSKKEEEDELEDVC